MKRAAVVGIVAGAVVAAAGVGVAIWAVTQSPSPEATAESYLRALSEGDFDDASAFWGSSDDASEDELRRAFEGASGYITDYDFTISDEPAGRKGVRAAVRLGGEPGVVFFGLELSAGRWVVASDYLGALQVTTTLGDSVRVGDALHFAGPPTYLLPAVYPVTAAPAGILTGSTEAIVTNEGPVRATVEASLAPEATGIAQEQLDAYAEACAEPAVEVPANCGLVVPWQADLASLDGIRFRVEQLPSLTLAEDGSSFAATGGVIVATATGTARDGSAASVTYRADDWALRGTLRFAGDELALRVG